MNFKIENGSEVESLTTGFRGVITARADHLHGCARYWVQPPVDKDKKARDGIWMDEGDLKVLRKPKLQTKNQDRGGFPSRIK